MLKNLIFLYNGVYIPICPQKPSKINLTLKRGVFCSQNNNLFIIFRMDLQQYSNEG